MDTVKKINSYMVKDFIEKTEEESEAEKKKKNWKLKQQKIKES